MRDSQEEEKQQKPSTLHLPPSTQAVSAPGLGGRVDGGGWKVPGLLPAWPAATSAALLRRTRIAYPLRDFLPGIAAEDFFDLLQRIGDLLPRGIDLWLHLLI